MSSRRPAGNVTWAQLEREDDAASSGSASSDDANALFNWEKEYQRSWEDVQEDDTGKISGEVTALLERQKRKRRGVPGDTVVRRGMVRALCLIVDLSKSVSETDLRPNRLAVILSNAELFIREYFDQNPVSQLCIIVTRNKVAEKLTELSGNPNKHITLLKKKCDSGGEISLQNALETARETLSFVPHYASKEIVVLLASLSTCDPEVNLQGTPMDIHQTIDSVAKDGIRCSVLGMGAEMFVCNVLCKACHGEYNVAFDETHYKALLREQVQPPPTRADGSDGTTGASLIPMGFPKKEVSLHVSLCSCHGRLTQEGYYCPRCAAKVCELPIDCPVCGRNLASSPHLARSYHHLFPVPPFKEIPKSGQSGEDVGCTGCNRTLEPGAQLRLQCPTCQDIFCVDCDIYIHESGLSPCRCSWRQE